jgi:hypothetical protein
MPRTQVTPLTGTPKGGLIQGIAYVPGETLVHVVPKGDTHIVWIYVTNNHPGVPIRVVGHMRGGEADQEYVLDATIPARGMTPLLDGHAVEGPCTIKVSAMAGPTNVLITGRAERIRHH